MRKVGAPGNPELAVGAVGEGDVVIRNRELMALLGLSDAGLDFGARRPSSMRSASAHAGSARIGRWPPSPSAS